MWKETGEIDLDRPIKEIWDELGSSPSGQTVLQGMAEVTQPLFNETKGTFPALICTYILYKCKSSHIAQKLKIRTEIAMYQIA